MKTLPDILDKHLKVLFIGYNPGLKSAETGYHYASKSNHFWKLLFESGLIPVRLGPEDSMRLLEFGLGSTNIIARPTKSVAELKSSEFVHGSRLLRETLLRYRPRIACYMGIGVYVGFSGRKGVKPGIQPEQTVKDVIDFVCTSPSGLNRTPRHEQLLCFKELKRLADTLPPNNFP